VRKEQTATKEAAKGKQQKQLHRDLTGGGRFTEGQQINKTLICRPFLYALKSRAPRGASEFDSRSRHQESHEEERHILSVDRYSYVALQGDGDVTAPLVYVN
jgi:hypothetical protein